MPEDDAAKRICVWVFGRRVICVGVESTFQVDDFKLEGKVKFDRNLMVVTGFPKDLNGQSFQITEIASFDHPERKGIKFDIYPSKVFHRKGSGHDPNQGV